MADDDIPLMRIELSIKDFGWMMRIKTPLTTSWRSYGGTDKDGFLSHWMLKQIEGAMTHELSDNVATFQKYAVQSAREGPLGQQWSAQGGMGEC